MGLQVSWSPAPSREESFEQNLVIIHNLLILALNSSTDFKCSLDPEQRLCNERTQALVRENEAVN